MEHAENEDQYEMRPICFHNYKTIQNFDHWNLKNGWINLVITFACSRCGEQMCEEYQYESMKEVFFALFETGEYWTDSVRGS